MTRAVYRCLFTLFALGLGCSVGAGEGTARGPIHLPACSIDSPRFDLAPDFFGGDWYGGTFTIQLSHGGDTGEFNDALLFRVNDTAYVSAHLGERIAVGPAGVAPVQATLRLSHACGRRNVARWAPNGALEAYAGYIVFTSIYRGAPSSDAPQRFTDVSAFSISLRDPRQLRDISPLQPTVSTSVGQEPPVLSEAWGELEGNFSFYFSRGRPAQRFQ